jgi:N-acyl-D-amino-acid deacylase
MRRAILVSVLTAAALLSVEAQSPAPAYDVVIRNGTVIDGSGSAPFPADVAIIGNRIARVGRIPAISAAVVVDAQGLYVTPGFINIHSHAGADALPRAENMLTQGVTTEILNSDGGGALDIRDQLNRLETAGLAVNVGAYAAFNSIWRTVVGLADRRPDAGEIARMRGLLVTALDAGAWGVSAGLDYQPAYFARTDEVIAVVSAAAPYRTNFTNHDRVTPETKFSSRAGIEETLKIAAAAGMVPVITHMKVTGAERGSAGAILRALRPPAFAGHAAADAYPYLAGQTQLGALIVPAWAQDGGRPAMVERFKNPEMRQRIAREAEEVVSARFGGPENIYLPGTRRQLADVMREFGAPTGETIIRLLEQGSPAAILHFGQEDDLREILRYEHTSIACDCGATTSTTTHPRNYGSYPRVLGRYVREQKVLTWPDAIRKMTALPAATLGMTDRGYLAPGMAADVTVVDPAAVIDRATYENPAQLSEGIRHVFVNGVHALNDGSVTDAQGGRALFRQTVVPSRPAGTAAARKAAVSGATGTYDVTVDVAQPAGARNATGVVRLVDRASGGSLQLSDLGPLHTSGGWFAISGIGRVRGGSQRAVNLSVLTAADGRSTIHAEVEPLGASVTIDDVVEAEMARQKIPGVAVAVIRKGEAPRLRGYGFADVEHRVPVTPDTIFQSGSLGKQFTAAAVMMLVEDGKLALTDPLSRFFPDTPEAWKRITVRHLLTHTSGLPDYTEGTLDYRRDYTEDDLLKFALGLKLEFEPGARWNYSNTGYVLLGIIIRKASGQFYGDVLRDRLFRRLGMNTARIITEADIVPHRADGYRLAQGQLRNQDWVAPQLNTTADGSLYLSLRDLVAWDAALRAGTVLDPDSWRQAIAPVALNSGRTYPYGFGWSVGGVKGRPAHRHGGAWQGFRTDIVRYTDDGTTIVVLANLAQASPERISDGIAQLLRPTTERAAPAPRQDPDPAREQHVRRLLAEAAAGKLSADEFAYVRGGFSAGMADRYRAQLRDTGALRSVLLLDRAELGDDVVSTYRLIFERTVLRLHIAVAPDGKIASFSLSTSRD